MTLLGADTDALDHDASAMTKAAGVCDDVAKVCEAIVAASFFLGPFGAQFIAYLEHTVIPWLKKTSEALTMLGKVLTVHADAQRQASDASSLTSGLLPALPSFVSTLLTTGTPGSTADVPSMSASPERPGTPASTAVTHTSWFGGLYTAGYDANGNQVDQQIGFSTSWGSLLSRQHWDVDAAGNTVASTDHYEERVGSVAAPWLDARSDVSTDAVRDDTGAVIGTRTTGEGQSTVFGAVLAHGSQDTTHAQLTDADGVVTDTYDADKHDLSLFGGNYSGATNPGDVPKLPGRTMGDQHWQPFEYSYADVQSTGPTFGDGEGHTEEAHSLGYVASNLDDGGRLGMEGKVSADYTSNEYHGTTNWDHHRISGDLDVVDVGAGAGVTATTYWGTDRDYVAAQGGAGFGPGAGLGYWDITHDGVTDRGVYVAGLKDFGGGLRDHHDDPAGNPDGR